MTTNEANARIREYKKSIDNQLNEMRDMALSVGSEALAAAKEDERNAKSSSRGRRLLGFFIPAGIVAFISILLFASEHYFWWVVLTIAGIVVTFKVSGKVSNGPYAEINRANQTLADVTRRVGEFKRNIGVSQDNNQNNG